MKYLIAFKFGPEKVQAIKTQSVRNNISGGVGIRGASTNIKVCCNDDVIAVIGLLQIILIHKNSCYSKKNVCFFVRILQSQEGTL